MSFFCIKLEVGIHEPQAVYAPADKIALKMTGNPSANVFLVAVDKGVYVLNNKNRLTLTKVSNYHQTRH